MTQVVELSLRYDETCVPDEYANNTARDILLSSCGTGSEDVTDSARCGEGVGCTLTVEIEQDMDAPVYLYYELDNYYQNHRR